MTQSKKERPSVQADSDAEFERKLQNLEYIAKKAFEPKKENT